MNKNFRKRLDIIEKDRKPVVSMVIAASSREDADQKVLQWYEKNGHPSAVDGPLIILLNAAKNRQAIQD